MLHFTDGKTENVNMLRSASKEQSSDVNLTLSNSRDYTGFVHAASLIESLNEDQPSLQGPQKDM